MSACIFTYLTGKWVKGVSEPRLLVSDMCYTFDAFLQLEIMSLCNIVTY